MAWRGTVDSFQLKSGIPSDSLVFPGQLKRRGSKQKDNRSEIKGKKEINQVILQAHLRERK